MRFIDRILLSNKLMPQLVADMCQSTVLMAQNVHAYFLQHGNLKPCDLPNLTPPFSHMFIEYTDPYLGDVGWLMVGMDTKNNLDLLMQPPLDQLNEEGVRWVYFGFFFSSLLPEGCHMLLSAAVHEDGTLKPAATNEDILFIPNVGGFFYYALQQNPDEYATYVAPVYRSALVALATICFMNTHNVSRTLITPPEPLQKKHAKRKGARVPLFRYYTFHVLEDEREGKHTHTLEGRESPARHIVKGTFVKYGEKGLFGRYPYRTIWRPSHRRGKVADGIVMRDIDVS